MLAVVLFIPTILIFGEPLFRQAPLNDYLIVLVSGALGIGISDTMFFTSLNRLGASLIAIIDCLYSPFIIVLSIMFLGESLTILQVVGVMMILSAILTATHTKGRGKISRHDLIWGVFWGVMALATMAIGIVMVKPILDRSPLLWVTEMRLVGGAITLFVILLFHPSRRKIMATLLTAHSWRYTISGSFFGAYLAMLVWLAGMKFTQASTAAALNQTSNIFIFIFAAVFLKEAINLQRTLAIIIAVAGVLMVIFF